MAEVLVTAMPFSGHVIPLTHVAEALVRAGHRVRFHTGSRFTQSVRAAGAQELPWRHAPDFDEHDLSATFPATGRGGPLGFLANLEHVFLRTAPAQVQDLREEWERRPWDLLVADSTSMGGALAAELLGTPWATVSVAPLALPSRELPPPGLPLAPARGRLGRTRDAALRGLVHVTTRRLRTALADVRAEVGLGPTDVGLDEQWFSPFLVLTLGIPGLEPVRGDLPTHVHFVGSFAPADGELPPGWDQALAAPRPVVHVTQGTFGTDPQQLLRPALEALGQREVTVAAVTGITGRDRLPFPVPGNAVVAGRVPHGRLLPRTDVVVTNGGWGGVLATLRHGVPLVVAGADLDKPVVAARVARSGAGIDLRTGRPSARAVGEAVDTVLRDPSYRRNAQRLAAEFAAHDTPAEVVGLLGQLLDRRAPVLRSTDPWAPPTTAPTSTPTSTQN
ncbi:glycosyltransferase [Kineococcus sp. SYSU DK003]|uniref:glycosyltransferase n=1 Tax=Kineococcus sp. SYSU DK003 TaxID=3383124 RepID=UPI003D7C965A